MSTAARAPRSTVSDCGSANWLDHRVAGSPSTAFSAPVVALSLDEALATPKVARLVTAAPADRGTASRATTVTAEAAETRTDLVRTGNLLRTRAPRAKRL